MEKNLIRIKGKSLWHIRVVNVIRDRDESLCGHVPSLNTRGEPAETELGTKVRLNGVNLCKTCLTRIMDEGFATIDYVPTRHLETDGKTVKERNLTLEEYSEKVRNNK